MLMEPEIIIMSDGEVEELEKTHFLEMQPRWGPPLGVTLERARKAMKQEGIKFTDLIRILTKEELLVGAGH